MLDRDAGMFRLGPADTEVPAAAATSRARWCWRRPGAPAPAGSSCATLLLIGPWHHDSERSRTHRRSPTDYDAEHVLLRTIRCVNGEVEVNLDCQPLFDYGRVHAEWDYTTPATARQWRGRARRTT